MRKLILKSHEYNYILEAINNFYNLDKAEREILKPEIEKIWLQTYDKFSSLCKQDQDWNELHDFNKDYEHVTSFDNKKHVQMYTIPNRTERKIMDIKTEFDPRRYHEIKNDYENFNENSKKIKAKMSKIEHRRFVLGRKFRLENLDYQLYTKEFNANYYADLKAKEDLKQEYIKNRTETYFANREKLDEIYEKYATDVIYDTIRTSPSILCVGHNDDCVYGHIDEVGYKVLNDVCNTVRTEFIWSIMAPKDRKSQPDNEMR